MIVMDKEDTEKRDLALDYILMLVGSGCLSAAKMMKCPRAVWYRLHKIFVVILKAVKDAKQMRFQNNEVVNRRRISEH